MPTVNAEIKRIIKEKDRGIKTGVVAMRDLLKELHGQVMDELGKAAIGSWDQYRLRQMLDSLEGQVASFEAQAKTEAAGLLSESWKTGQTMVDAPLAAANMGGIYTGFHLATSVLDVMKDYTFHRIASVSSAAWDQIRGELTLGILGDKTPQEVAAAIGKNIDAGRFKNIAYRAETITQTEMGRVFSQAAENRMEQAAEYVEGLEKEWIHAGHPKAPRPAHVAAHGQHVPVNEPFMIGGIPMMFPRDSGAPIDETIHCGCDHVPYHARWA